LVRVSKDGHQKYYQANADSPVFEELVGLVRKTVGLAGPILDALAPLVNRIQAAFIYGSVASGTDQADSDIDLMVIADNLDYATVFEAVRSAERRLGRTVNPTLMTLETEYEGYTEQDESTVRQYSSAVELVPWLTFFRLC